MTFSRPSNSLEARLVSLRYSNTLWWVWGWFQIHFSGSKAGTLSAFYRRPWKSQRSSPNVGRLNHAVHQQHLSPGSPMNLTRKFIFRNKLQGPCSFPQKHDTKRTSPVSRPDRGIHIVRPVPPLLHPMVRIQSHCPLYCMLAGIRQACVHAKPLGILCLPPPWIKRMFWKLFLSVVWVPGKSHWLHPPQQLDRNGRNEMNTKAKSWKLTTPRRSLVAIESLRSLCFFQPAGNHLILWRFSGCLLMEALSALTLPA